MIAEIALMPLILRFSPVDAAYDASYIQQRRYADDYADAA